MGKKKINALIIGLSGSDGEQGEYKIGKSLFCNRFVRPGQDEQILTHDSIYETQYLSGPVISDSNFLFWGTLNMRVESSDSVDFNVVEYTHLRNDINSYMDGPSYLKEAVVDKLLLKEKLMYISPQQVKNPKDFKQVAYEGNEFTVDGFILAYCADAKISYSTVQDQFVASAISSIEKLEKPWILVLTKCDEATNKEDITNSVLNNLKSLLPDNKPLNYVIETSALLNVNIVSAFQLLYSCIESKGKPVRVKNYLEAYRTIENRNAILIDGFSNSIMAASQSLQNLSLESMSASPKFSAKTKNIIDALGRQTAQQLLDECRLKKMEKLREKLKQYCLSRFEVCVSSIFKQLSDSDFSDLTIDGFLTLVKNKKVFDFYFEDTNNDLDSISYVEGFLAKTKSADKTDLKIPIFILKLDRFKVLFEKLKAKFIGISQTQNLKNQLHVILKKLAASNKLTLKTTFTELVDLIRSIGENTVAECLTNDPHFKNIYNTFYQNLLLRAKYQLHEMIFENVNKMADIKYLTKTQLVDDVAKIIKHDPRFQIFDDRFAQVRSNWIFNHYTFVNSTSYCLLSPVAPCYDQQAKNVLSSLFDNIEKNFDEADNDFMILFVIANYEIYSNFEKELLKFSEINRKTSYFVANINGFTRSFLPVNVESTDVNWDQVFIKYSNHKLAFAAIYGDASSYKLIENHLMKLNTYFNTMWKSKEDTGDNTDRIAIIERVENTPHIEGGTFMANNIVVIFCLRTHIIDEYRSSLSKIDESIFFQESMLGRLVEQGRNLCSKYSAKFIDPYLDEILDQKTISPLHEFQVMDAIKYLEETVFDRPCSLLYKHDSTTTIRLVMCCMCGDNYPLEIIVGMLLYGRNYEYSVRRETVYFEYKIGDNTYMVSLKVVSYHSAAVLVRREIFHGSILVYNIDRDASYEVMINFGISTRVDVFHIIGISGISSHARLLVQTTKKSSDMASLFKADLELTDPNETNDIVTQANNFDVFLQQAFAELSRENDSQSEKKKWSPSLARLSCENLKFYGKYQLKPNSGTIREDRSHKVQSMIGNTSSLSDKYKNDVLWSDNPAFGATLDQASFSKLGYSLEDISKCSVATPSETDNLTVPEKSGRASTKRSLVPRGLRNISSYLFDSKPHKAKNSMQSEKGLNIDNQAAQMRSSGTSTPSEPNKAKKFQLRFVTALQSKKKSGHNAYDEKMKEWEAKFAQKTQETQYKYFGKNIETIASICDIPIFVIKCVAFIEENGLEVEGLYRRSGSKQDIETLKLSFEANFNLDFSNLGFSVHVFSGSLKAYFNHLPTPFIPESSRTEILDASGQADPEKRISLFKDIVSKFPDRVRVTLNFLMNHFAKVCENKDKNKMDARNLAICFWPSLIKYTTNEYGAALHGNNMLFSFFIHNLIENTVPVFGECPKLPPLDMINLPNQNDTRDESTESENLFSSSDMSPFL